MGATSKRAKKIRTASEFDLLRLRAALAMPRDGRGLLFSWKLDDIFKARDAQMIGQFFLAARMAESMRTDDALFVAYQNRLDPQRCLEVKIEPAPGARGLSIANEADALYGARGVAIKPEAMADVNGCLVNHGVAFGINTATPRADGARVDLEMHYWPIEYVRWDPTVRVFKARVDPTTIPPNEIPPDALQAGTYGLVGGWEVPIIHGDGRWVIFKQHEIEPWRHGALLSACGVWARHAFAVRDWAKGSVAHGAAKTIGELPEGMPLQDENGQLTAEAAAFLELLRLIESSDEPIGIRPAGSKTDFLTNNSTAWQVWTELVANAERAAARIYLGTDGMLGAQGGAPGVDIAALFGVAITRIKGDLAALERGIDTGVIQPWCAMNFGDSTLTPRRRYVIPDAQEAERQAALGAREQAFWASITAAGKAGFTLAPDFVKKLAAAHCVIAPELTEPLAPPAAAAPSTAPSSPPAAPSPPASTGLRLVPPLAAASAPREPTALERAEHASRMTAALLADIREARALGFDFTDEQIAQRADAYGVPVPKRATK